MIRIYSSDDTNTPAGINSADLYVYGWPVGWIGKVLKACLVDGYTGRPSAGWISVALTETAGVTHDFTFRSPTLDTANTATSIGTTFRIFNNNSMGGITFFAGLRNLSSGTYNNSTMYPKIPDSPYNTGNYSIYFNNQFYNNRVWTLVANDTYFYLFVGLAPSTIGTNIIVDCVAMGFLNDNLSAKSGLNTLTKCQSFIYKTQYVYNQYMGNCGRNFVNSTNTSATGGNSLVLQKGIYASASSGNTGINMAFLSPYPGSHAQTTVFQPGAGTTGNFPDTTYFIPGSSGGMQCTNAHVINYFTPYMYFGNLPGMLIPLNGFFHMGTMIQGATFEMPYHSKRYLAVTTNSSNSFGAFRNPILVDITGTDWPTGISL